MDTIEISEHKHLNEILELLKDEYSSLKSDIKNIEDDYSAKLKEASEEARQDDAVETIKIANRMMQSRDYIFKRNYVKRMESQIQTPYFARIDFVMEDSKQSLVIYIGKHSFLPKNIVHRISDWRAPISSLYYNYQEPQKNVKYEFDIPIKYQPWKIEHKLIKGDLNLRRNIDIVNQKISGIYDNNLRVDLLSEAIKKKTGGVLEDIVKTIQAGQNEIIRSNPYKLNVIQGTAGSGKTTVAIHRISYLFYTFKDEIREDNTLLLSSSKILVNYVAKTLPELEIYSLTRNTLLGLIIDIFKSNKLDFKEINFTKERNGNWVDTDINEINNKIETFSNRYKEKIHAELKTKPYYKEFNIERQLLRMENRPAFYQLKSINENIKNEISELNEGFGKGNLIISRKIETLTTATKEIDKILKAFKPIEVYDKFVGLKKFDRKNIDIDEISIMYLLIDNLYGLDQTKYKQVIVDEGQDLSLINYLAIKNLSEGLGITILGDLNQATEDEMGLKDWKDLEEIFAKDDISYHEIKISYRTTKQIIELAKSILQKFPTFKHLPEPFRREGENPKIINFKNKIDLLAQISKDIENINSDNHQRSIGIIEPDTSELDNTAHLLKSLSINCILVDEKFEDFNSSGTYLIPQSLVKGLEFDTVFIIDPNEKIFPKTPIGAKKLFVACTRSINRLFIYGILNTNSLLCP
ncbi:hypothetical protein COV25_03805 [candidate division WWE3 bacterium CG10_big_fil_rev_8_21_14_0_10_35_32]|nr:MAG: hypothetical protein COV25_03805 [candidate division WWE3 bacterium CG10_big_fil_rev_8_21_14_0_10_35_32]